MSNKESFDNNHQRYINPGTLFENAHHRKRSYLTNISFYKKATPSSSEDIIVLWNFATEYNYKFHLYKYTCEGMQYIKGF